MNISRKGLNLIKEFEGCRLTAYRCPSNVLTIGWGHTGDVYEGQTITQEEANNILVTDLVKYENYVKNCSNLTFTPNQNQFDALVSFTYNCGQGSLNTLTLNRNVEEVSNAILLYNRGNDGVLPGLVRRREAEKSLFLSGDFEVTTEKQVPVAAPATISSRNYLQVGDTGPRVTRVQNMLTTLGFKVGSIDGKYGAKTKSAVYNFQQAIKISADGLAGDITLKALEEIISKPLDGVKYPHYEYATRYIQYKVGAVVDGIFGNGTAKAVKSWQQNNRLSADGIVGPKSWSVLI